MRQERTVQASIFDLFAEHEIGRELRAKDIPNNNGYNSASWRGLIV